MREHEGRGRTDGGRPYEETFQGLPPLDSQAYITLVRTATTAELPPEVLARAWRQLPPNSPAAEATLERLFKRSGNTWDHLQPLVAFARRRTRGVSGIDYEELLQKTLVRISGNLRADRGEYAERAWHAYCRRECSEAWRDRFGRRSQKLALEPIVDSEKVASTLERQAKPVWFQGLRHDGVPALERLVREVADTLPDGFVKDVAEAAWFSCARPATSGQARPEEELPLMARFPDKSRDAIARARRRADTQLMAALLASDDLDEELKSWLRGITGGRR